MLESRLEGQLRKLLFQSVMLREQVRKDRESLTGLAQTGPQEYCGTAEENGRIIKP